MLAMKFCVAIGGLGRIPAAKGIEDFVYAMVDALRRLGHEVGPKSDGGRLILFNASAVNPCLIPDDAILYNSEQVSAEQKWNLIPHIEVARERVVWDYCDTNVSWLKAHGVARAVLCPVGYAPSMERIRRVGEGGEGIDVLFYGALNDRRKAILDELDAAGLRVTRLLGVFGEERDKVIARAKVVLNLHFYDRPVFEIFRVSHLLANRKCVLSEGGGQDVALEDFARCSTRYTAREDIVEQCRQLVMLPALRHTVAVRGYAAFRALDLVENVRTSLDASA